MARAAPQLPGLTAIVMVEYRAERRDKTHCETRFHIASQASRAPEMAKAIRQHWAIENGLHWVLDMVFRDDECRVRSANAPANFTTIKHMAANLLRTAKGKESMRLKRRLTANGTKTSSITSSRENDIQSIPLSEALSALARLSLIEFDGRTRVFSTHRLVQLAARADAMPDEEGEWLAAAVIVCSEAHPGFDFEHWQAVGRLLPHARHVSAPAPDALGQPLANLLGQIGRYLDESAAYSEAEPFYKRSLNIREKALGPNHPNTAMTCANLANLFAATGRLDSAQSLARRAYAALRSALGETHPNTTQCAGILKAIEDAIEGSAGE